jgi:hypothetical protein
MAAREPVNFVCRKNSAPPAKELAYLVFQNAIAARVPAFTSRLSSINVRSVVALDDSQIHAGNAQAADHSQLPVGNVVDQVGINSEMEAI